jgi:hypothetical protein
MSPLAPLRTDEPRGRKGATVHVFVPPIRRGAAFLKKPRSRIDLSTPGIPPVISTVVAGCGCLGCRVRTPFISLGRVVLSISARFTVDSLAHFCGSVRDAALKTPESCRDSARHGFTPGRIRFSLSSDAQAIRLTNRGAASLGRWIRSQPRSPLFLSTAATPLTAIAGGRFHWLMCDDPGSQTRAYFAVVGIEYLVTTAATSAAHSSWTTESRWLEYGRLAPAYSGSRCGGRTSKDQLGQGSFQVNRRIRLLTSVASRRYSSTT